MTAAVVPLVIAVVVLLGSLAFARTLESDGPTSLGRMVKIAGGVVFALGAARAGWLAFRGVELPSIASSDTAGGTGDGIGADDIRAACLSSGAVGDAAGLRAHCECTLSAVQSASQTDPSFAVSGPPLSLEGSASGLATFRQSYGQCALPHVREWIGADCRASCEGDTAACARTCSCVATEIARGKSAIEIGTIYWPERPELGTADYTIHNLVVQASFRCQVH